MITENYVSLEIAKSLKQNGFNEDTDYIYYYYESDDDYCFEKLLPGDKFDEDKMLHCPTIAVAMKWLRKKHNVFISPVFVDESYEGAEKVEPYYGFTVEDVSSKKFLATSKSTHYDEPEDACEDGIKYCLEHKILD
ncbi:MAG: hypothetical protein VZR10_10065 [Methanobrevibacter sp.]|nr:hypothetical protein [Methanobrevibacter sp.]